MNIPDNDKLRAIVNSHLGTKNGESSKPKFEKAKSELIVANNALIKEIGHLTIEKHLALLEQSPQSLAPAVKAATDIIDSYFIPLPNESINAAFIRAQKEAVSKLKSDTAQLKYFSFKDYNFKKKKKAPTRKIRTTNFENVRVEKKRSTQR